MKKSIVDTYDLEDLLNNKNNLLHNLDRSMIDDGIFCIYNHGIKHGLVNELYLSIKNYFELVERKPLANLFLDKASKTRYFPVGAEKVSGSMDIPATSDLCESIVFSFQNDNIKNKNIDQTKHQSIKRLALEYKKEIDILGRKLLMIFAFALNINPEIILKHYVQPRLTLRFANYPVQASLTIEDGQMRYGAHTDYGVLTILKPDSDGLQVADIHGNWYDISCPDDGFVINSGDLLSFWTAGRWRSVLHRVINPTETSKKSNRISIVAFFDPNRHSLIEPITGYNNLLEYKSIQVGEYIDAKLKKSSSALEEQ